MREGCGGGGRGGGFGKKADVTAPLSSPHTHALSGVLLNDQFYGFSNSVCVVYEYVKCACKCSCTCAVDRLLTHQCSHPFEVKRHQFSEGPVPRGGRLEGGLFFYIYKFMLFPL